MKLRIILPITILCLLILFVGCDNEIEEEIVNTNLDEPNSDTTDSGINEIEEKDDTNMVSYTYDTLNEYFELGTKATDIADRVAYIENIENVIDNSKIKIIDIKVDKYIIFEVYVARHKAICVLLKNETLPKIVTEDNRAYVEIILKEDYCIIDSRNSDFKYIIDLTLSQNDKNFITQINVIGDIYDISNKDWIVYQSSSSNAKSLGSDIKYYNLCTKQIVTYRESGEDYGWVIDLHYNNRLFIYKLNLNNNERVYYEAKELDNWQDRFEPSSAYLSYDDIGEYISKSIENPTETNIKDYIYDMPTYVSNCIVEFKYKYETDKYFVIFVKEKYSTRCDYNKACLWEKGKSNGGMIIDNNICSIDGLLHNKYLVTDKGTYITRGTSFYNLDLDATDENFSDQICTVLRYCMFDKSDWVIYCPVTKDYIKYGDIYSDIALYNLKTNENIIYKEASENYSFTLRRLENKKVNIVKIERDEDSSSTRTAIEAIDLTDFQSFEKNIIN